MEIGIFLGALSLTIFSLYIAYIVGKKVQTGHYLKKTNNSLHDNLKKLVEVDEKLTNINSIVDKYDGVHRNPVRKLSSSEKTRVD